MKWWYKGYEIEELRKVVEFNNIKHEWQQTVTPSIYNLTHTYEWFYSTWKSQTGYKNVRAVTIRKENRLISVMHLIFDLDYKEKTEIQVTIPTSITPFFAAFDRDSIVDCLLHYLDKQLSNWNVLQFEEFDFSFPETEALISSGERAGLYVDVKKTFETPVLRFEGTFEEYYLERKKRIRKAVGNKLNTLRQISDFRVKFYSDVNEIQGGIDRIQEVDCMSWKFNEQSDMASRPGQFIFYETWAQELAKRGNIILAVLELVETGEPIAFEYIVTYADKFITPKRSYKQSFHKFSPGVILRYEILKNLLGKKFRVLDSWGKKDEFKMIWSTEIAERYTVSFKKL